MPIRAHINLIDTVSNNAGIIVFDFDPPATCQNVYNN